MKYQSALFSLQVIKIVYSMAYDVAFQYFLLPYAIWQGLQQILAYLGLCSSLHGQYFELLPATLFFITVATIDSFAFLAFSWIQNLSIMRAFGFSNATPGQFLCSRVKSILQGTISMLPLILFAMVVIINFAENLTLAFFFGTFFGKVYQVFILPQLKCFDRKRIPFPDDRTQLKNKICELATEHGYPEPEDKVWLTMSKLGDLHSNASVNSRRIELSKELLEHH
jgi:hypothetical protein